MRKLGKKFVYDFCDEKKVAKIENSKLFQNPRKIEFIMLILFLLPGTPKDLLVYVAGLPSVISSTLAGDNVVNRRLESWDFAICCNSISGWNNSAYC